MGTLSALDGTLGTIHGLPMINYLEGETYDELVAQYAAVKEPLMRLESMIQAKFAGTRAIFNEDGSVEIQIAQENA
jgi:hypothetical protein